jgi:starch synthase
VSRTYAEEIQTAEFGMGLEGVLASRRDVLRGIVNGVDYGDWDPATDALIPHNYTPDDLSGKSQNKKELLEQFELGFDERVPLFGIVSRLTGQKGFDLLPDILPILLQRQDIRLVVLGSGESVHEEYFQWLRDTYPTKVANYRGYNNELAHRIEAGADMFLMPSRYEPCGLNQMYSLKYGTVPIVRQTGGLADTVQAFDPATGRGTGFVFGEFRPEALLHAVRQALEVWSQPPTWARLVQNGMAQDYSWERQGREYEELYASLRTSS